MELKIYLFCFVLSFRFGVFLFACGFVWLVLVFLLCFWFCLFVVCFAVFCFADVGGKRGENSGVNGGANENQNIASLGSW